MTREKYAVVGKSGAGPLFLSLLKHIFSSTPCVRRHKELSSLYRSTVMLVKYRRVRWADCVVRTGLETKDV
jgi:hypothetical protein